VSGVSGYPCFVLGSSMVPVFLKEIVQ